MQYFFFHKSASNRRRRNKITYSKDDAGKWLNDQHLIMSHGSNYFNDTFTTSHLITDWNSIKMNLYNHYKYDLTTLDKPLLDSEITRAIFSFKPFKVPWPDILHPFFFQKYQHIIGQSVKNLCHKIFNTQQIPNDIIKTYLCLIPKIPNANNIEFFRSISLCNTIYKTITKILANCLKPFLDQIISPFSNQIHETQKSL